MKILKATVLFGLLIIVKSISIAQDQISDKTHVKNGLAKIKTNDKAGAFEDFTKAIEVNEKNADAYQYRGMTYYAMQDYEAAITDFTKVFELDPERSAINWTYFRRGLAFTALGKHTKAVEDYTKGFDHVFIGSDVWQYETTTPTISQMIKMKVSYDAISKSGSVPNKMVGKWLVDNRNGGGGGAEITYAKDGIYTWGRNESVQKRYQVVQYSNQTSLVLIDSLDAKEWATYKYEIVQHTDENNLFVRRVDENSRKNPYRITSTSNYSRTVETRKLTHSETILQLAPIINEPDDNLATNKQLEEALAPLGISNIMDLEYVKLRGHYNAAHAGSWDLTDYEAETQLLLKNVLAGIDSLKKIGKLGKFDKKVYQVAQDLGKFNPEVYAPTVLLLLENHKYNEALFMAMVGSVIKIDRAYRKYTNLSGQAIGLIALADFENYIQTTSKSLEFIKANEEKFSIDTRQLKKSKKEIEQMRNNSDKIIADGKRMKMQMEMMEQYDQARNSRDKSPEVKEFPVGFDLTGHWYGLWHNHDDASQSQMMELMEFKNNEKLILPSLDAWDMARSRGVLTANYTAQQKSTNISLELTNVDGYDGSARLLIEYIDDNTLRIGEPYLNKPDKMRPNSIHIITRIDDGAKLYHNYDKSVVQLPAPTKTISDKELKKFWESNITPMINLEKENILSRIIFPVYLDYGGEVSKNDFEKYNYNRLLKLNKSLRGILMQLDYSYLEPVALSDGSQGIMLYIMNLPEVQPDFDRLQKSYNSYGFLFIQENGQWMLNNISSSTISSHGYESDLLHNRQELLQQGENHRKKRVVRNSIVQPIISGDMKAILKSINFPLQGNWGSSLDLTDNPSTWTKENFKTFYQKYFDEETIKSLSEETLYEDNDNGTGENYYVIKVRSSSKNKVGRAQTITMKFGKRNNVFKMVAMGMR